MAQIFKLNDRVKSHRRSERERWKGAKNPIVMCQMLLAYKWFGAESMLVALEEFVTRICTFMAAPQCSVAILKVRWSLADVGHAFVFRSNQTFISNLSHNLWADEGNGTGRCKKISNSEGNWGQNVERGGQHAGTTFHCWITQKIFHFLSNWIR